MGDGEIRVEELDEQDEHVARVEGVDDLARSATLSTIRRRACSSPTDASPADRASSGSPLAQMRAAEPSATTQDCPGFDRKLERTEGADVGVRVGGRASTTPSLSLSESSSWKRGGRTSSWSSKSIVRREAAQVASHASGIVDKLHENLARRYRRAPADQACPAWARYVANQSPLPVAPPSTV